MLGRDCEGVYLSVKFRKLYEHPIFIQLVGFAVLIGIVLLILISVFVFYKMADMAREGWFQKNIWPRQR